MIDVYDQSTWNGAVEIQTAPNITGAIGLAAAIDC